MTRITFNNFIDPNQTYESYSYAKLKEDVASVAHQMQSEFGLKTGDRVCAYVPNIYEAAVAMLATASFGAVWSSTSTDFGPNGVLDRFSQVEPKLLFVTDTISYKQKLYPLAKNINEIVEGLFAGFLKFSNEIFRSTFTPKSCCYSTSQQKR